MGVSSPHFCIFISRSQYQPVDRIENYWTPWLCCTFQQGPLQQVGPLHWKGSKETLEGRLQWLAGKLWTIHLKFWRNKPETNGCSLNQKEPHLFKGWHLVGCHDFIHPKRPVKVPGIRDLFLFILPFWPGFGGELIGFTKAGWLESWFFINTSENWHGNWKFTWKKERPTNFVVPAVSFPVYNLFDKPKSSTQHQCILYIDETRWGRQSLMAPGESTSISCICSFLSCMPHSPPNM